MSGRYDSKHSIYRLLILALTALLLTLLCVCTGSVRLPVTEAAGALFGRAQGEAQVIIMRIRLPRALAALILGGALALSGYLMQTFFHNPIAGPYVLGVSSGAKLCVALTMIFFAKNMGVPGSIPLIIAAFIGAALSMGFVLLMAGRLRGMSMLIVAGIMVGYICSAVTDFIVTFADDADIASLHGWSRGSFSGMTMPGVAVMAAVTGVCFVLIMFISKPISAYLMGEDYARGVGVRVDALRVCLILLSCMLAACVTAFAGPVSFVGIAVPRIMERIAGTSKPIVRIPACLLGGGIFCLICDMIARTVFAPAELSISTVTAVFGAPVVLVTLLERKGRDAK